MVNQIIREMGNTFARGETLKLPALVSWPFAKKGERGGRNPKTGGVLVVLGACARRRKLGSNTSARNSGLKAARVKEQDKRRNPARGRAERGSALEA
jgi:hypothetical protein